MPIDVNNLKLHLQNKPTSEVLRDRRRTLAPGKNETFGDMLSNAINSVDQQSKTADKMVDDVVSGKSENIHDTMIQMQKAELSFQLMLEIRNKAIETYQELSRMQL